MPTKRMTSSLACVLPALIEADVQLIEQPLRVGRERDLVWLRFADPVGGR